jgi:hypothetical protein
VKWLILALASLLATPALGFVEMVRLGYNGCASCHVSPTGGGALTAYGRSVSEETSSWAREGDGQLFNNVFTTPDWLAVGGDTRYVGVSTPDFERHFLMQEDVEVGVRPVRYLWLVASGGWYGEGLRKESRRHYLLWTPSKFWSVRLGKFFPAYGVLQPDHTVSVRQALGWREGAETINAELYVHSDVGEVFVTQSSRDPQASSLDHGSYAFNSSESSTIVRAAKYLGRTAQLGASYWYCVTPDETWHAGGLYGIWGITRDLYLTAEADYKAALTPVTATWTELGYELVRGVHVKASHELTDETHRYGIGAQWWPMPHYELLLRGKWQEGVWAYTAMIHLNL